MIKTDQSLLVYKATPGPWTMTDKYTIKHNPCDMDIVKDMDRIIARIPDGADAVKGKAYTEAWKNACLVCAAPSLLKVAQKLLLWMEECLTLLDLTDTDIEIYKELREAIKLAGGFSSETQWWQGPCVCSSCGYQWDGIVKIPIQDIYPSMPIECIQCFNMTGNAV